MQDMLQKSSAAQAKHPDKSRANQELNFLQLPPVKKVLPLLARGEHEPE